jgi:ribonuclease BN (tRNA processing enzyme)
MKVIFLGTNGWYDTETGNTSCILLETRDYSVILDAGSGLYKLEKYIDWEKPGFLFLSHFHLDHIIGLHTLIKFNFKSGLQIYGQKGTKKVLNQVINQLFTVPFNKLPFRVKIQEISEGTYHLPFLVKTKFLIHSSACLGYRFEIDKKKIAYCTDTGICKNLKELAKDVDLLITECSLKSGQIKPEWPHLNPEMSAEIAKKSNVKKLILTHFDSNIYKTLKERKEAERIAKKIFKKTIAAVDGIEIKL